MRSWWELWRDRGAAERQLLSLERRLANYVAAEEGYEIEDLRDPHGKRFLFDDFEGMAQQSKKTPEAISASLKGGTVTRQLVWARSGLQACLPGCACACDRCAYLRERARYIREGAILG
jgi:hypothetical protein